MTDENIQTPQGTEVEPTTEQPIEAPAEATIDYKDKFSASTRENQRILEEIKAKDAEIERLRVLAESGKSEATTEPLYPGFETLSESEQEGLIAYTNSVKKGVKEELYKDPAIAYAQKTYAETKWNEAFESAANEYPELRESKDEFKQKYFNAGNVPENIGDILKDLSKVYLFDKARDIGAKEAIQKASHYEIERAGGGDKTPTASRSLEDWHKLAQENPAEFARKSAEYKADLDSGKL